MPPGTLSQTTYKRAGSQDLGAEGETSPISPPPRTSWTTGRNLIFDPYFADYGGCFGVQNTSRNVFFPGLDFLQLFGRRFYRFWDVWWGPFSGSFSLLV